MDLENEYVLQRAKENAGNFVENLEKDGLIDEEEFKKLKKDLIEK